MKQRTTDYKPGSRLVIIDTYFHPFNLGEVVIVKHADLFSYHVRGESTGLWCWVKEMQVTMENKAVLFTTETNIPASYYFTPEGELRLKICTKIPKGYYYSCLNEVGEYYQNHILPIVERQHPSQLIIA